jgi:hypothetical protein
MMMMMMMARDALDAHTPHADVHPTSLAGLTGERG